VLPAGRELVTHKVYRPGLVRSSRRPAIVTQLSLDASLGRCCVVAGPIRDRCCASRSERDDRGLNGVQLIISDAYRGLMESAAEYLPEAQWQRCMVHFYRNVFSHVPATKVRDVSHMLKAIHAQESQEAANQKAKAIVNDLRAARMNTAADLVERCVHETLTCRVGGGAY
jgi:hypothetical protein